MTAYETLTKLYTLEASLMNMEERCEELRSSIPELKYRKREAEVACVEGSGGFKRFLSRLSGKAEEDSEALARAARAAGAALESAQRELTVMEDKRSREKAEYDALGDKASLMAELSGQEREHFLRLEASLCAERALHLLRKARKELTAAQELARNPMMTVGDGYRENTHKANAGALADKCREKLEQIRSCGFGFEIHPYLENPMGYIVSAMRYGDLDRMNSAQNGIRETEAALKELLLQLAE